ncbi:MAG: hypothetical protein ACYDAQ_15455 [Mycobacteriales bacterium]
MSEHPSIIELAADPPGEELAAHLRSCAECAAAVSGLAQVDHLLAGLPAVAMPPDVAARLDARLAAEHAPHRDRTVLPLARRRGGARTAALAAAAVAVLLAAGLGLGLSGGGPHGAASSVTRGPTAAGPATRYLATGTDYTPAGLASQVRAILTPPTHAQAAAAGAAAASVPEGLGAVRQPESGAALAGCLAQLALVPGAQAVAVDQARFAGRPALIVVEPGTRNRYGVYVVTPACSASAQDVLFFAYVPR